MHRTLGLIALLALTSTLNAMPLSQEVIDRLQREERLADFVEKDLAARMLGVNAPFDFNIAQIRRDEDDEINVHAICLLVDFEDNEANDRLYSVEHYESMLFSEDEFATGSMHDWYLENSYGQINITGEVLGWYRMPQDYAYYVDGNRGFSPYPRNAQSMVEDALRIADEDVNYRDFDNDDDGYVEALFVVHAGQGYEQTGDEDMIHSHAWNVPQNVRLDNVAFRRYAMEPDNGKIGVFGHELGHSFFGLPDLYDTDYNSAGIGNWSMMSGGSWGGGGNTPVHFDGWCKQRIGISDPFPIVQGRENILLNPMAEADDQLITWRRGNWNRQYFLIENRQQIGFDRSLPSSGLLIWHIDDAMESNSNPWWPGEGGLHNIVALEQADGGYDLEQDRNSGDDGDPFPGSSGNITFSTDTSPSSKDYLLSATDISVYRIERADSNRMSFSVALAPLDIEDANLFILNKIPEDHLYFNPDNEDAQIQEIDMVRRLADNFDINVVGINSVLPDDLGDINVIIYLESWRVDDELPATLSYEEQIRLMEFLNDGHNLLLIGPEIGTNLSRDESPLWPLLHVDYINEGQSEEEGNLRTIRSDPETFIGAKNFVTNYKTICDHYIDEIAPKEDAQLLFNDHRNHPRGAIYRDQDYAVIVQPFLFGAVLDYGATKLNLFETYFRFFRFYLNEKAPESVRPVVLAPLSNDLITAFPNPFNSSVNIDLSGIRKVKYIDIYDGLGRNVARIGLTPGQQTINWKPINLPTGSYWLQADGIDGLAPLNVMYLK